LDRYLQDYAERLAADEGREGKGLHDAAQATVETLLEILQHGLGKGKMQHVENRR